QPEPGIVPVGRWAVVAPAHGGLQGGAPLQDEAHAHRGEEPGAALVSRVERIVGVVVALLLLQPVGGVVAVVFPRQIGVVRLVIRRLPLGLLLEAMRHQEACCVPDRRGLAQVFMVPG
ncbi:MAG: hypothetical protein ACK55I_07680, partial [bacterium]